MFNIGSTRAMSSATSEANIARGQASMQAVRDKEFAQKLKEAQAKAMQAKASGGSEEAEKDRKLREACREMEALFLNMVLTKMRDTIPERTLFPKSSGEKIMQSMLDVEFTRSMAQGYGVGLGELLYKQLANPGVKNVPENVLTKSKK